MLVLSTPLTITLDSFQLLLFETSYFKTLIRTAASSDFVDATINIFLESMV